MPNVTFALRDYNPILAVAWWELRYQLPLNIHQYGIAERNLLLALEEVSHRNPLLRSEDLGIQLGRDLFRDALHADLGLGKDATGQTIFEKTATRPSIRNHSA